MCRVLPQMARLLKLLPMSAVGAEYDVLFNPKDLPEVSVDSVLEIYHPDALKNRLLVQVRVLKDDIQQPKDSISLSSNIVKIFCLKVTFKEQYWGRADMWDIRKLLLGNCIYRGQRIQCFQHQYAVVDELWSDGERVTCGCVVSDTLFAFRSLTSQVNIFIQMSAEMWSFDRYGYLHFEKTVAFLEDLFRLWTEKNCNHDLTVTLFSRSFYDARSLEEFPEPMRECVRTDCRGRFYEDFYHVVIQNERCDDWTKSPVVNVLRTLFDQYENSVVCYHEDRSCSPPGQVVDGQEMPPWKVSAARGLRPPPREKISIGPSSIPRAWNSSAPEGNVLEVLNMGLNVFEKYYVDRSFDRTGKLSVVLTPGAGVFDVDRSLANITRQRTIDCGSSSTLVCMAEQPENAVPMFIFTRSDGCGNSDFNIPHWIKYSYYVRREQLDTQILGNFAPWCDVPLHLKAPTALPADDLIPPFLPNEVMSPVNYDEYDDQTFRRPVAHVRALQNKKKKGLRRRRRCRRFTPNILETVINGCNRCAECMDPSNVFLSSSFGGNEKKEDLDWIAGSVGTPTAHCRSDPVFGLPLINPFSLQRLHFKVTANQRRWTHAFMTGGRTTPTATASKAAQPGRRHRIEVGSADGSGTSPLTPKESGLLGSELRPRHIRRSTGRRISESSDASGCQARRAVAGSPLEYREASREAPRETAKDTPGLPMRASAIMMRRTDSSSSIPNIGPVVGSLSSSLGACYLNGAYRSRYSMCESEGAPSGSGWGLGGGVGGGLSSGEREWSAQPQSSMDWKSLAYPPSLPLTTDFFPDRRSLENDYVTSEYTLLPEDMCADLDMGPDREKVTAPRVYNQMVLQRLAQNFQIVLPSKPVTSTSTRTSSSQTSQEIVLSVGRIFHILTLSEPVIRVKSYSPRHPFPRSSYNYTYRFRVPDSPTGFDTSCTQFTCEPLELYRWNYVDQYLGTRGEDHTFKLQESLKYWRARFCLINLDVSGTKRLQTGASMNEPCDVFGFRNQYNHALLTEGLMKFLETENKLKRISSNAYGRRDSLMNVVYLTATRDPLSIFFNAVVDNCPEFLPSANPGDVMRNPMADKTIENSEEPLVPESLASLAEVEPDELEQRVQRAASEVETGTEGWVSWRKGSWDPKRRQKWLTRRSDRSEVIRALTDPVDGLGFVQTQPGSGYHLLPDCCFISEEAALWSVRAVEGVDSLVSGIAYMQQLVDDGCIRHASGNRNLPFIYGFYLYFVVTSVDPRPDSSNSLPLGYAVDENFDWQWCEVAISENSCRSMPACLEMFAEGPPPARPTETSSNHPRCRHKEVSVDVDPCRESSRQVWGTARYHATFNPDTAFELTVEWLAATGPILGDLIATWSRKANGNGLHFLPVPRDPFVLPQMANADPLRAPIFVPLNLACLRDGSGRDPFDEFPPETRSSRILLLQFSILDLFGFIRDRAPTAGSVAGVAPSEWPQFIHCTGGMLVTVPQLDDRRRDGGSVDRDVTRLYRDYIARQCLFLGLGDVTDRLPAGFLWAWNFMLNKRWRNMVTGDEMLQDRMLSDLRRFCDGSDGRLSTHWGRARTLSDAFKKFEQLRTGSHEDSDPQLDH